MFTIKEQEELNINAVAITNTKLVLEECSDLLISLEEFSTTIDNVTAIGDTLEPSTLAVLNLAFNNVYHSTGLMVHPPIALEDLTDDNVTIAMEGIGSAISSAIKKTWDTIGKTIRSFIDKKRAFFTNYFTSMKGLLDKVQALKAKVIMAKIQASTNKKITLSANIAKATYVPSGSNLIAEIERINKRILDTSGGSKYEEYLEMLFHTMIETSKLYKSGASTEQMVKWEAVQDKLLACTLKAEDAFKVITEGMTQTGKNKDSTTYTDKVPYLGGFCGTFILYNAQIINDNYKGEYYPPEFSYSYSLDDVANIKSIEIKAPTNLEIIKQLTALEGMIKTIIEHRIDTFERYSFMSNIYTEAYDTMMVAIGELRDDDGSNPDRKRFFTTMKHVASKVVTLTSSSDEPYSSLLIQAIKSADAIYLLCSQSFVANSSK